MKDEVKYEAYLSTIVNTRLIYNTIKEYEDKLDNHSLHNNGVKRCINTPQKIRSAYRDFQVEVSKLSHAQLDLDELMEDYQSTWIFYNKYLSRRRNPLALATKLLAFIYPPFSTETLNASTKDIFEQIVNNNLNVPLLFLMILKILPGYESKEGDVFTIARNFHDVITILEDFTSDNHYFAILPAITQAKEEANKTRLTLIYHVQQILDVYTSFYSSKNCYEQTEIMKQEIVDLELDGFWNNSSGTLISTYFLQIEHALNDGTYFVTLWHKNSDYVLKGTKYTMFLMETTDHKLMAYILHPQAIRHRIDGIPYSDADNVWYETNLPKLYDPNRLMFDRMMDSNVWPKTFNITRVTDSDINDTYQTWLDNCNIVMNYKEYDYYFEPCLYAATKDYLYLKKEKSNNYYKIPRNAYQGLENVQLNDLAGIMTMNNKEYIVFDELLLYIEINSKELKRYNINIVDSII